MSNKKFVMQLNDKSISDVIRQLAEYRDGIKEKTNKAINALLDIGYEVAMADYGEYGGYVTITRKVSNVADGVSAIMIVTDVPIKVEWLVDGGIKRTAEIRPILMAEFGSGWEAEVKQSSMIGKVGQGTFPGQTHAFDKGGWNWMGVDKKWHHSQGIKPTHPLYNATMEMFADAKNVFRSIFG